MRLMIGLVGLPALLLGSVALSQGLHRHDAAPSPNISPEHSTHVAFDAQMASAMEHMHAAMAALPKTNHPDKDFLAAMIPHHQGAIKMAKAVLLVTQDPAIRNLAQSIITDQQYEIELMRTLFARPSANSALDMEKKR
jgi:uncharacterized protein (DUF305 family)